MTNSLSASPAWADARKVLCVRLDARGDVLMSTPAIRAIKESLPGCSVTLLTSHDGAEVAPLVPEIDDWIVYDPPWMKSTPARTDSAADMGMIGRLRERGFDAAVIFTVYSQNPLPAALLCYLAEIPLRLAHCHENPYQLLTDWVPDPEPARAIRHEVQRQLDLVDTVELRAGDQRLSLQVPGDARAAVQQRLAEVGIDGQRPWVAIHPGASAPSRRYPWESFADAGRMLAEAGWQIVFTGSAGERELVERIRGRLGRPSFSLAGRLSFAEFAAAIEEAPLLIANNTSAVHIAAAVGTPVVDLYALTNPQHTPWGVPNRVLSHDVPCRNCYKSVCPEGHHNCLRLVAPEDVARAALELGHIALPLAAAGSEG